MEVFRILFAISSLEFGNFCTKPSLWSQKMTFSYFFGKIQKWPFLAKFSSFFYLRGQLYIACGFQLNFFILPNYVLIFPNFVFQVISRYSLT